MSGNRATILAACLSIALVAASLPAFCQSGIPLQSSPPAGTTDPAAKPPAKDAANKDAAGKDTAKEPVPVKDPVLPAGKDKDGKPLPPGTDPTATHATYVIGPEDALFVRVWQQPELSGSVTVSPDGTISLQLTGEVKAAGLTPRQLEQELAERLRKYLKELNPEEVNVSVLRINSRTYLIQGEVNRPGVFPITRPMTVMEALVNGGGFGPFANKKKIYILRGSQKFYFNWMEVSKGKNLKQDIPIQNGDQIYVP
jgi:polysaccharide export outer membrane protein